jgi:Zn-dependent protease
MFRRAFRLPFDLARIPLYVDFSFLLVLPLMAWGAMQYLGAIGGGAFAGTGAVGLGLICALGLFACVVAHELGHSLAARRYGVRVRRITLWFLGGVAEFEEMPKQRGAEAVVGIAGPLVSFALAGVFWAVTRILPPQAALGLWLVSAYLAMVNLMLGLFNLLPALPMDGGRILRSLLALRMPHARATVIAGTVAKVIALGMGVLGFLSFNVWFIILAFFIFTSVNAETRQSVVVDLLRDVGVADLMNRDVATVPAWVTVGELAPYVLGQHRDSFPVVDDRGRLIGTIGVEQMQRVHPATPAWQAMEPTVLTINERASALDAFQRMSEADAHRLVVVDNQAGGAMVGTVSRSDLSRAIQMRMAGLQVAQGALPVTPVQVQRAPWSPQQASSTFVTPDEHAWSGRAR